MTNIIDEINIDDKKINKLLFSETDLNENIVLNIKNISDKYLITKNKNDYFKTIKTEFGFEDNQLFFILAIGTYLNDDILASLELIKKMISDKLGNNEYILYSIQGLIYLKLGLYSKANISFYESLNKKKTNLTIYLFNIFFENPNIHPERLALLPICKGKGLEIGCGHRKTHPNVLGLDLNVAGEVGKFGNVTGHASVADIKGSGDNLDMFSDNEFDYVIQRHNLEHYQDYILALQEWTRVLKPGGILGMVVPDDENCDTIKLDPTHYHVFTRKSLERIVNLLGDLQIIENDILVPNWSFRCICVKNPNNSKFNYLDIINNFERSLINNRISNYEISGNNKLIEQCKKILNSI